MSMEWDNSGVLPVARAGVFVFVAGAVQTWLFPLFGWPWWTAAVALAFSAFGFIRLLQPPQYSHSVRSGFEVTHYFDDQWNRESPSRIWVAPLALVLALSGPTAFFSTPYLIWDSFNVMHQHGVLAFVARCAASCIPLAFGIAVELGWRAFAPRLKT
jgi:hypothetical protein